MKQPTFDDFGYPTEETLQTIRARKIENKVDARELLEYCMEVWYYPEYVKKTKRGVYEFSTGGWSGNEDIIEAMEDNQLFWSLCWQESRRGGHYRFDLSGVGE